MKKTLGGDRLGAGKKQNVHLHNYERSTHDLGYIWRSTMSPGTLVPFLSELALPGDTFDINLQTVVLTHPTIGPLFGSYKEQLDIFIAPIRLYNAYLHNNLVAIGMTMQDIYLPQLQLTAIATPTSTTDLDNSQINPSSILSYLGIRGIGQVQPTDESARTRTFNATPWLAYWEIYKNYYANKQEENGAVINTPIVTVVQTITSVSVTGTLPEYPTQSNNILDSAGVILIDYTGTPPIPGTIIFGTAQFGELNGDQIVLGWTDTGTQLLSTRGTPYGQSITVTYWRYQTNSDVVTAAPIVEMFALSNIDDMRMDILATQSTTTPFLIDQTRAIPYGPVLTAPATNQSAGATYSQQGLGIKTYQSDLFNNWLLNAWIDGSTGINQITAIDTSSGSFEINTFILAKKVFDVLNRIAVSGGTYDDWIDAVYAHEHYTKCETPMYMGGLSKEVIFQQVVSTAATSGQQQQPLGTLAGRGHMGHKHKGGKVRIKVDEPSYIIGIVSLTPRLDYSQGNKWDTHLQTYDDFHKPGLDGIGFQDLITEQMAWWDTQYDYTTNQWVTQSAGKQPAWINYMTNVNQTRGNFAIATNEMFMTLNRRYAQDPSSLHIQDLTTYIEPSKYNFIFAYTALDAQNFWTQIAVDITARRKMSAKVMPNL